jgi:DNA-binding GntR family transcriptional regulator
MTSQERARFALLADLRERILSGELAPGRDLTQLALANDLGVSRTPLREALRVLEGEGFVEMRPNGRMSVTTIDVADLEQLYGMRITLESFACQLSVPDLTPDELDDIGQALDAMVACSHTEDIAGWEEPHQRFHHGVIQHAGTQVVQQLRLLGDRARLCRQIYLVSEPRAWGYMHAEHRAIYDACVDRDADAAALALANHLAHTALTVIAHADPTHEPRAVRTALRVAITRFGDPDSPSAR